MLLTVIGIRILVRFAQPIARLEKATAPISGSLKRELVFDRRGVKTAAFLGGVTNGMIGAWGPVVTPFLLHRSVRPRYAIGCVNTAEVAVASASAFSLIASLGRSGINGPTVLSLLIGGVLAAPVAAWFIRSRRAGPHGCVRRRSAPVDQCARSDGLGRAQVGPGAVGRLREYPRGDRPRALPGARARRLVERPPAIRPPAPPIERVIVGRPLASSCAGPFVTLPLASAFDDCLPLHESQVFQCSRRDVPLAGCESCVRRANDRYNVLHGEEEASRDCGAPWRIASIRRPHAKDS